MSTRLVLVPLLTPPQQAVLRELLAASGEKEFAGRKLATARELMKKKHLANVAPGREPLGKWFRLNARGREVGELLGVRTSADS